MALEVPCTSSRRWAVVAAPSGYSPWGVNPLGGLGRFAVTIRDISELKRSEASLIS